MIIKLTTVNLISWQLYKKLVEHFHWNLYSDFYFCTGNFENNYEMITECRDRKIQVLSQNIINDCFWHRIGSAENPPIFHVIWMGSFSLSASRGLLWGKLKLITLSLLAKMNRTLVFENYFCHFIDGAWNLPFY